MSIILGRPFLATAGEEIDLQAGTISFRICGERVNFCFLAPISPSALDPPAAPMPVVPPDVFASIKVFDGDGGLCIWPVVYDNLLSILTSFGVTSVCTGDVMAPTPSFYTSTSTPPESSPFTIWR